jgi:hypothetical protein
MFSFARHFPRSPVEIPNEPAEKRGGCAADRRRPDGAAFGIESGDHMWLYVGNLAYGASDADLVSLFSLYGRVGSAIVARDRSTGRSKDFGFVSVATPADGRAAIEALNGKEIVGCTLRVAPVPRPPAGAPRGATS